ncbi:hypothetical protein AeMF1_019404 [Aphanomyces euteiches]|nr:hypothetical protein AeMF1_019404 [Aphanomyces euteiches]KAH9193342.1 hypothetical protein AeNC1_004690 [Aphanomyces euteiches]
MSCCPADGLPAAPTTSPLVPENIEGTDIFYFDNPNSHVAVLAFPDVYGPDSGRTKQLCADLSKHYKVALVDICDGDYRTATSDRSQFATWAQERPFEKLKVKIDAIIKHLQTERGVTKFGAMGFCYGAWIVARLSAEPSSVLSAGISFHPSWHANDVFRGEGSAEKIAHDIQVPQSVLTAGNDRDWLKPGGSVEQTLQAKGVSSRFREFPNMVHGWVIRGDLADQGILKGFHDAWVDEALPFLKEHLVQ